MSVQLYSGMPDQEITPLPGPHEGIRKSTYLCVNIETAIRKILLTGVEEKGKISCELTLLCSYLGGGFLQGKISPGVDVSYRGAVAEQRGHPPVKFGSVAHHPVSLMNLKIGRAHV